MTQFQVPQFIEVEDKIIGPLTLRQFIYLAGGGGLSFLLYTLLPLLIALPLIAAVVALSVALAFYKFNNKPFVYFLEASFKYLINTRLYIWKKEKREAETHTKKTAADEAAFVPRLSDSRLKDLAWSLDVHDTAEDAN